LNDSVDLKTKGKAFWSRSGGDRTPRQVCSTTAERKPKWRVSRKLASLTSTSSQQQSARYRQNARDNQVRVAEVQLNDSIDLKTKGKVFWSRTGGDRTPRQVCRTAAERKPKWRVSPKLASLNSSTTLYRHKVQENQVKVAEV
jgi:hypothetical protein